MNLNLYILLLPLRHDGIEDIVEKNLVNLLNEILGIHPVNVDIYLESETRTYVKVFDKVIKRGLEDCILLALFELSVYMMSIRDYRIYEKIYEGMGRVDPDTDKKRKAANLSTLALKVAKGSEAILNLRDSTNLQFRNLTNNFDIKELIKHKYDESYIYSYSLKLEELYQKLIELLSENEEYVRIINFKYLQNLMNTVSDKEDLEVSDVISMRLKTYIMRIRNQSNLQFVLDTSDKKGEVTIAILLTGNAHIPDYKFILNSLGIKSKVLGASYTEEDTLDKLLFELAHSFEEFLS